MVFRLARVDFVRLDDWVVGGPSEIMIDALHGIRDNEADLEAAKDDGCGPVFHKIGKGGRVGEDIVFGLRLLKISGHKIQGFYFTCGERSAGGRGDETGQVRAEANLGDGDGRIGLIGKNAGEHVDGFRDFALSLQTTWVDEVALRVSALDRDVQHGRIVGRLAVADEADGDVGTAVEVIHKIDVNGGVAVVLRDGDSEQTDFFAIFKSVNHAEGEGIVAIVAHVGIEDEADGFGGKSFEG